MIWFAQGQITYLTSLARTQNYSHDEVWPSLHISCIDNGSSSSIINKTYVNSIWHMTFRGVYKYFQLNNDMVMLKDKKCIQHLG